MKINPGLPPMIAPATNAADPAIIIARACLAVGANGINSAPRDDAFADSDVAERRTVPPAAAGSGAPGDVIDPGVIVADAAVAVSLL
jgi:hypothetical protein